VAAKSQQDGSVNLSLLTEDRVSDLCRSCGLARASDAHDRAANTLIWAVLFQTIWLHNDIAYKEITT
jgi:hypothetical protein